MARTSVSRRCAAGIGAALAVTLAACAPPQPDTQPSAPASRPWSEVTDAAQGQEVRLWMWGGDPAGNAYVDEELVPAARAQGVRLRRVPVADTKDAVNRILTEVQAGTQDGEIDLVWVNGDNFASVQQARGWRCEWASSLPNAELMDPDDLLLTSDFGVPTEGCESPWHKAQFTFVYDAGRVQDPPRSLDGLLRWAQEHPGRFTYPTPGDFTGSVFLREVLRATAGGAGQVPLEYSEKAFDELTPATYRRLEALEPALWRGGQTYPRDAAALDRLFADGQVDITMTYGPATLTGLVADGTFGPRTRVLTMDEGTVGNASFLAIPVTSGSPEGAMVVADLALSPEQQTLKADPEVWGQFTVLDLSRLDPEQRRAFQGLPSSPVVPPLEELVENAHPELSSDWVGPLDEGWRRQVLGSR